MYKDVVEPKTENGTWEYGSLGLDNLLNHLGSVVVSMSYNDEEDSESYAEEELTLEQVTHLHGQLGRLKQEMEDAHDGALAMEALADGEPTYTLEEAREMLGMTDEEESQ